MGKGLIRGIRRHHTLRNRRLINDMRHGVRMGFERILVALKLLPHLASFPSEAAKETGALREGRECIRREVEVARRERERWQLA